MSLDKLDRPTMLRHIRRISRQMADPPQRAALLRRARNEIHLARWLIDCIECSAGKTSRIAREVHANARRNLIHLLAVRNAVRELEQ